MQLFRLRREDGTEDEFAAIAKEKESRRLPDILLGMNDAREIERLYVLEHYGETPSFLSEPEGRNEPKR